jgi:carboxyl-terminal processing protease
MPVRRLGLTAAAWCVLVAGSLAAALDEGDKSGPALTDADRALNVESFELAWATIRDKHWDPELGGLDWQAVHDEIRPRVEKAQTPAEFLAAMNSMIDRFGQSHFAVVPKDVYDQMQAPPGEGPRDGATGIDVRVIDGQVLVTTVEEGTPAAKLGVKPGWEILQIDAKPLSAALAEAEKVFQGKASLELIRHRVVTLRLSGEVGGSKSIRFRNGSDEEVTLEVGLAPQKGNKYQLGVFPRFYIWFESRRVEGDIGYIAFNGFMDPIHVMPAFEKAVTSFLDSKGIILDIRGNGGGLPPMAMGMAGRFVDRQDQYLGTMRLRGTELRFVVNPKLETYRGPVAVLIDGSSASCAEIFAGGMRDMGRARLFGTRTAGAVLPAHFMKLPNGDFFYFPIADYFSQSGARLEAIGVEPDVHAPHERAALLEGRDSALREAMLWIQSQ